MSVTTCRFACLAAVAGIEPRSRRWPHLYMRPYPAVILLRGTVPSCAPVPNDDIAGWPLGNRSLPWNSRSAPAPPGRPTPLLNRRGFRRACDQWADGDVKDASACCVMVDLDGFKAINDRHGHPVGDAALIQFAATLRLHMRPTDTIARLGGDEFALILPNCSGSDARKMLARLQDALAVAPLPASGSTVFLRFSAGIAERHADESLAQALERADAALLDAKRQGKATVSLGVLPARPVGGRGNCECVRPTNRFSMDSNQR